MRQIVLSLVIFIMSVNAYSAPVFEIIPLGVYGGLDDGNLSAYLLKSIKSEYYIALDGGTLINGLKAAINKQSIPNKNIEDLLNKYIPAYLISHAHLDHLMGLVIAQPELREQQTILAQNETLQALQHHIFNWSVWGNFGNKGAIPQLNYQQYQSIPLLEWVAIPKTDLRVKTFPLSHGGMASSAFLIRYKNEYILYFGDTGSDGIEQSTNLAQIWQEIAPLIQTKQLHAIMLECSFLNSQPNHQLFGHLKPDLFMLELHQLASRVNPLDIKNSLKGLPVVVTHIKPQLNHSGLFQEQTANQIMSELSQQNDLGIQLIKPIQGMKISL
ncbi:MBL fold metallo-hydrolase [Legionella worsleiensis]|uniref:3',5'-cyclic-nucleotide phosphodiesterase n=1 Tax=Legionella worsleiensis TaxID=45076 RepID=A0A0W1A3F3_9GAMM|nr:3',5'-cyclic-nucleotide phosphodiesterase [Legionella worsleiensis]KTD75895.1 3',5'-cyclic-nucleotide phosphodiesterase [Legionella worsleiensis]STY32908.1 3',5'-cyclic-nucleotide phosphodiesterase [Legionella worsleiensis]